MAYEHPIYGTRMRDTDAKCLPAARLRDRVLGLWLSRLQSQGFRFRVGFRVGGWGRCRISECCWAESCTTIAFRENHLSRMEQTEDFVRGLDGSF